MPENSKTYEKLVCDWSDKFGFLLQYRYSNFLLRHVKVIEGVEKIALLKQKPCLETDVSFTPKTGAAAKKNIKGGSYKLLNDAFFGQTLEDVRKRLIPKTFPRKSLSDLKIDNSLGTPK